MVNSMIGEVIIGLFIVIILGCCMLSEYKAFIVSNDMRKNSDTFNNESLLQQSISESTDSINGPIIPINLNTQNNNQILSDQEQKYYDNNLPLDRELGYCDNAAANNIVDKENDDSDLYGNNNADPDELVIFDNY